MTTEDDQRDLRNVDRERRRRENELLLLLLLAFIRTQRDAQAAAAHGHSVAPIIAAGIIGSSWTGHLGISPVIARTMAQAHRDGFRRAGLMVGVTTVRREAAGTLAELAQHYMATAAEAARAMVQTVTVAVGSALADVVTRTPATIRRAVAEAFDSSGYTRGNPYALDIGAERAVVSAHNAGIMHAALGGAEDLRDVVTGLKHISVIDGRTTDICRQRDNLQLPIDHPYWRNNVPALHCHCRSILKVLKGYFVATESLPTVPPDRGFGAAPSNLLASIAERARNLRVFHGQ